MALPDDPTGAKEIAKTAGKAIDAGRELGGFVGPLIRPPLEQLFGMVTDSLSARRRMNQIRLDARYQKLLNEQVTGNSVRQIPLNVAVPALEYGSLEEDDALQALWAQLLVNASNATSGVTVKPGYLGILREMTPLAARTLSKLHEVDALLPGASFLTAGLPDVVFDDSDRSGRTVEELLPPLEVQLALWDLLRFGCITFDALADGAGQAIRASITPLGRGLIEACSPPR